MSSMSLTRRAALAALAGSTLPNPSVAQDGTVRWSSGTEKPRSAAAFKRILVDNPAELYSFPPVT